MAHNATESCARCKSSAGELTVYRDPFGRATAPGRWPTLTMHSDCFLAYIKERKSAKVLSSAHRATP